MFDLNGRVREWRERQERTSSLSPRELDELEDHLRARVDLELGLNSTLAPSRAFAIARRDLGKPTALEKEFAKAGRPRWRRWLVAGWTMFGASFILTGAWTLPARVLIVPIHLGQVVPVVLGAYLSPLTNLLMLATLLELRAARPGRTRWLAGLVSFAAVVNLASISKWLNPYLPPASHLVVGISVWVASFFCVTAALWMRVRELKPGTLEPSGAQQA